MVVAGGAVCANKGEEARKCRELSKEKQSTTGCFKPGVHQTIVFEKKSEDAGMVDTRYEN